MHIIQMFQIGNQLWTISTAQFDFGQLACSQHFDSCQFHMVIIQVLYVSSYQPLGNSVDKVLQSIRFGADRHLCKLKCEASHLLSLLDVSRSERSTSQCPVRTVQLSLTKSDKITVHLVMDVQQYMSDLNYFVNIDLLLKIPFKMLTIFSVNLAHTIDTIEKYTLRLLVLFYFHLSILQQIIDSCRLLALSINMKLQKNYKTEFINIEVSHSFSDEHTEQIHFQKVIQGNY